ncbi:modified peptide precursor CbpA [Archaeoglobus neptunius]
MVIAARYECKPEGGLTHYVALDESSPF